VCAHSPKAAHITRLVVIVVIVVMVVVMVMMAMVVMVAVAVAPWLRLCCCCKCILRSAAKRPRLRSCTTFTLAHNAHTRASSRIIAITPIARSRKPYMTDKYWNFVGRLLEWTAANDPASVRPQFLQVIDFGTDTFNLLLCASLQSPDFWCVYLCYPAIAAVAE